MIEVIKDYPRDVVSLRAHGHVTREDYDRVVVPAVAAARDAFDRVRLYYEIDSDFTAIDPAAIWRDFEIGVQTLPHWEKTAIVTDVLWIKTAAQLFALLLPGTIRIFSLRDAGVARKWIVER